MVGRLPYYWKRVQWVEDPEDRSLWGATNRLKEFWRDMGMGNQAIIPFNQIENRIVSIRGDKVMLDADLAELYGVTTKALNQAVKRRLGPISG